MESIELENGCIEREFKLKEPPQGMYLGNNDACIQQQRDHFSPALHRVQLQCALLDLHVRMALPFSGKIIVQGNSVAIEKLRSFIFNNNLHEKCTIEEDVLMQAAIGPVPATLRGIDDVIAHVRTCGYCRTLSDHIAMAEHYERSFQNKDIRFFPSLTPSPPPPSPQSAMPRA